MDEIDLEQLFEMVDTALTSKDERVQNALRSLFMIVALTAPTTNDAGVREIGPLTRLMQDLDSMKRRVSNLEREAGNKYTTADEYKFKDEMMKAKMRAASSYIPKSTLVEDFGFNLSDLKMRDIK
jgi:hypothetical protein